ncbi:MAG: CPBP family intramembrane metalloprotease [Anaerolineaceae bacterium]|nr:CPBP family intramembrane metalloprotease [Anaerolineaceae bacterium]
MRTNRAFRIWGFFAAVYLVSALLWMPVVLSGKGMSTLLNTLLIGLITFVPSVTGILFTYLVKDREGRRDFWRRAFRWPRMSKKLAFAALLIFPALNIGTYVLALLLAGRAVTFPAAAQLFTSLPLLVQFLVVEITFGALSEELGWRGYVLDELQARWSPLISALVLGVLWALWHTPAFLVPGMGQYNMGGVFSVPYLSFILSVIMASVVQTWFYNRSGRSILLAGFMLHFLANLSLTLMSGIFERFSMPDGYYLLSAGVSLLVLIGFSLRMVRWPQRQRLQKAETAG